MLTREEIELAKLCKECLDLSVKELKQAKQQCAKEYGQDSNVFKLFALAERLKEKPAYQK